MNNAVLLCLELGLSCLDLLDCLGDLKSNGTQLGVGHHPTGTEDLAQFAHGSHHIGSRDHPVELEPSALDLLCQVVAAHFVGTGVPGLLLLLALGKRHNPLCFPQTVGQYESASHHLIALPGVNTQPDGNFYRLVELGTGCFLNEGNGRLEIVSLHSIDFFGSRCKPFSCTHHVSPETEYGRSNVEHGSLNISSLFLFPIPYSPFGVSTTSGSSHLTPGPSTTIPILLAVPSIMTMASSTS